ncbi:MAG: DUF3987 domain-containing protein [Bacteroidales bacterium]|nr:DUF3987 domain-containing protein [Bacteroidales bacterium]
MSNPRNSSLSTTDAVEALTILIEAQAVDITASYADWLRIGFALADEFGFDGESYFHRISAFYPNYSRDEASQQYAKCLQSAGCPPMRGGGRRPGEVGKARTTIATLFYIAAQHGITLSAPCPPLRGGGRRPGESTPNSQLLTPNFSSTSPVEEFEENEENTHPMTFSQDIHENLPLIMQRIIADSHSDEDADILILGSITVFSACIPNVFGVYDRRSVNANLFLYVTAPASAGKGRLSLCRHLAAPIHQSLRDKYKRDMQEYNEKLAAYAVNKKNTLEVQPKEPPFLSLFVPANSTATVVYQTLSENNGVGLLFETEGDTLANAFKSDMGNYSDGFRKAFHHEPIAYLRKKDHEFVEILRPKFSAVLSGTLQQVFNLIPDAENGLFSRFIFYVMKTELVWRDMFPVSDGTTADERFRQIGKDFYTFLKDFPTVEVQFTLSYDQQRRFNDFFAETQSNYAYTFGDDIVASVRRLGLILFRIAMVISVLRLMDAFPVASGRGKSTPLAEIKKMKSIVCTDIDFQSAMAIVKVLLQHTAEVYQSLPRHSYERPASSFAAKGSRQLAEASRSRFFAALPDSFDRPKYIEVAASLNITEKTAERYVREFCTSGQLNHPSNGQYTKPINTQTS